MCFTVTRKTSFISLLVDFMSLCAFDKIPFKMIKCVIQILITTIAVFDVSVTCQQTDCNGLFVSNCVHHLVCIVQSQSIKHQQKYVPADTVKDQHSQIYQYLLLFGCFFQLIYCYAVASFNHYDQMLKKIVATIYRNIFFSFFIHQPGCPAYLQQKEQQSFQLTCYCTTKFPAIVDSKMML